MLENLLQLVVKIIQLVADKAAVQTAVDALAAEVIK